MNDWLLNVQSKNAFREIPEGKMITIMAGINAYNKQTEYKLLFLQYQKDIKSG